MRKLYQIQALFVAFLFLGHTVGTTAQNATIQRNNASTATTIQQVANGNANLTFPNLAESKRSRKVANNIEIQDILTPAGKSALQNLGQAATTTTGSNFQFIPKSQHLSTLKGNQQLQDLKAIGDGVNVSFSPENGTPNFVFTKNIKQTLQAHKAQGNELETVYEFLNQNADLFRLKNPNEEFQLRVFEADSKIEGRSHMRLDQVFQGVKVWASDVVAHFNTQGLLGVSGRYHPTPQINSTVPTVDKSAALASVKQDLERFTTVCHLNDTEKHLTLHGGQHAELVIYPTNSPIFNAQGEAVRSSKPALVWHITYYSDVMHRWEYFVDAQTGNVLHHYDHTCSMGPETAQATDLFNQTVTINTYETGGNYYMLDITQDMYNSSASNLPDDPAGGILTLDLNNNPANGQLQSNITHVGSSNNSWSDPVAVSAHHHAKLCYEYFKDTHGRNSLDGNGGTVYSIVNVVENNGSDMDNAFWSGVAMFYGNGNQIFDAPVAKALDVAGHEMSHGVIQNTANLVYQFQSGALNESFADVFGTMIDRDDWQLGEDITDNGFISTGALRDMQNPNNGNGNGAQPASMNEYAVLTANQDNGGVHINSGITNRVYYLFATAIGKDKAEQIYYRALTQYLTQSSQFIDCRLAVIQAAGDLYGNTEVNAAATAFDGVGIVGEEGGDYEVELPPVEGGEFMLVYDLFDGANNIAEIDFENSAINTLATVAFLRKPSVVEDGTFAVFVSSDNHAYALSLNVDNPELTQLTNSPDWVNIAVSKDGDHMALVSDQADGSIYVFDLVNDASLTFELYNPTTASGGASAGAPQYADVIEWDVTGEFILYDAYNLLVDNGGFQEGYWDLGLLKAWNNSANDFGDGTVFKVFNSLPENVSIGNATFAKNSPHIIAFDYILSTDGSIDDFLDEFAVLASNIETGDIGTITNNNTLGYPTYNVNDEAVAYAAHPSSFDNVFNVYAIAVNEDKISPTGSENLVLDEANFPVIYGKGERSFDMPIANFDANVTQGGGSLTVNFFDQSNNIPTEWAWTFQGGTPSNSSEQNPIVSYSGAGTYNVSLTASNPAGSDTETKNGYISLMPVGIEDGTALQSLTIFPNPTKGQFQLNAKLESAQAVEWEIYNALGQRVRQQGLEATTNINQTIDLSQEAKGLYFLRLHINGQAFDYKISVL